MRRSHLLALLVILLVAFWFRAPRITAGMPFFYDEDEAHHFSRLVGMVQRGSFNPRYFLKPTLHFYMRMPVVAGAFVWSARRGEIRDVQEIVTHRPGAVGGLAFTVSHPRIVQWNRAFTVCLSVLAVLLAFLLARELTKSPLAGLGAAALTAVSPALIHDAGKIGVDTPMVFMCLLAVYLAVRLHAVFSLSRLFVAGLVAGLAISTKYNAFPIYLVPLAACLLLGRVDAKALFIAAVAPVLGFVLGTPFLLVELPRFLNHVAFEAWHYAERGHGPAATGTPGLPQAMFYLRWFAGTAIGYLAVALAAAGAIVLVARRDRRWVTFLLFPVLFFLLMIDQKVNFTRNMLVMVPVLAVLAAATLDQVPRWLPAWRAPRLAAGLLFALAMAQPVFGAFEVRGRSGSRSETRLAATEWLSEGHVETAVASEVQMPYPFVTRTNVAEVPAREIAPVELYLRGFDRVVAGPDPRVPRDQRRLLRPERVFEGRTEIGRFPRSPQLTVYRIEPPDPSHLARHARGEAYTVHVPAANRRAGRRGAFCYRGQEQDAGTRRRDPAAIDGGCWVRTRLARILIDLDRPVPASQGVMSTMRFEVRSPWAEQSCVFVQGEWQSSDFCAGLTPDAWEPRAVHLPAGILESDEGLLLRVERVHTLPQTGRATPAHRERAGVALRGLRVEP